MNLKTFKIKTISFPETFYSFDSISNLNPSYHKYKIIYNSFSQSKVIYEYDMKKHKLSILEKKTLKNHNPKNYIEGYNVYFHNIKKIKRNQTIFKKKINKTKPNQTDIFQKTNKLLFKEVKHN